MDCIFHKKRKRGISKNKFDICLHIFPNLRRVERDMLR